MLMAIDIAVFLKTKLVGSDYPVEKVNSLNQATDHSLVFAKSTKFQVDTCCQCIIICPLDSEWDKKINYSLIKVENPRLAFAKVLTHFFVKKRNSGISANAIIGQGCQIDSAVLIGNHCVIGDNVSIGPRSTINHHVVIADNTVIGSDCYIKSGAILGEDGFGFDFEEDNTPVRVPHLGNVVIGNHVEIGANNTIARATLGSTIISDYVKCDDQVHIAHNCSIGEATIITAQAEISGSVKIGKHCWIGPNASIMQKVSIGDHVTIGLGAVVIEDVAKNKKVMGLDSLDLRSLIGLKKRINFGK